MARPGRRTYRVARDAGLLVARLLLGVVLMAHGYEKYVEWGLGGTADRFAAMGVPLPPLSAFYAGTVELVGGLLLVVGAANTLVSALVVLDMIGASVFFGKIANGIRLLPNQQGWELSGVVLAVAAALLVVGAGRYSVDHLLLRRVADTPVGRPVP